jgi:hypothetical protein
MQVDHSRHTGTQLILLAVRVAVLAIIIGLNQVQAAGSEDDCEGPAPKTYRLS